jgi:hypothetical protein
LLPCVQAKPLASPPLLKKQETVRFEKLPTFGTFSGMLQLLCTFDPQLSQGLTFDEKSAPLHGTGVYM